MRTRKTVVILLSGKAGSGKTTISDKLKERLLNLEDITVFDYGFADPLKFIALAYMGWDKNKDEKGRKLLQQIEAIGREYDENIWVKHFLNQMNRQKEILPFNFAIIDDWRFPNELMYLKNNPLLEVVTIRVFGRGGLNGDVANDVSENSLPEAGFELMANPSWLREHDITAYYDYQLDNSEGLELLDAKISIMATQIQKQYIVE